MNIARLKSFFEYPLLAYRRGALNIAFYPAKICHILANKKHLGGGGRWPWRTLWWWPGATSEGLEVCEWSQPLPVAATLLWLHRKSRVVKERVMFLLPSLPARTSSLSATHKRSSPPESGALVQSVVPAQALTAPVMIGPSVAWVDHDRRRRNGPPSRHH